MTPEINSEYINQLEQWMCNRCKPSDSGMLRFRTFYSESAHDPFKNMYVRDINSQYTSFKGQKSYKSKIVCFKPFQNTKPILHDTTVPNKIIWKKFLYGDNYSKNLGGELMYILDFGIFVSEKFECELVYSEWDEYDEEKFKSKIFQGYLVATVITYSNFVDIVLVEEKEYQDRNFHYNNNAYIYKGFFDLYYDPEDGSYHPVNLVKGANKTVC